MDSITLDSFARTDPFLLTVIMPAYNERDTIEEAVRRVVGVPLSKELIVVDDGSDDATAGLLEPYEADPSITVLRHAANQGKGAAIRTGLRVARGELTIIQDADLEYSPGDYRRLLQPLIAGEADVVYGSRYLRPGDAVSNRLILSLGIRLLNRLVRVLYGARISDEATCYKVFRTETLRQMDLKCCRFEFCPEVTAKACRMGLRIAEVAIQYDPRTYAQGKKIGWRDGIVAVRELWKWRRWNPALHVAKRESFPERHHHHQGDSRSQLAVRT